MHASSISPEPITVLHVDDDPDFADMTATFLQREDDRLDAETATSATDGLDLLDELTVDCIVSDYDMPDQNGIEFLRAVRERDADIPFILFTGKGSEEVAGDAASAGATDYLQKSGGAEQYGLLANRIINAVEGYRARRQATRHQRINAIIREVNRHLVTAQTVEEIEREVCDALADSDSYRFAWIGAPDPETDAVVPRTSAGETEAYLAEQDFRYDDTPAGRGPAGQAVRTRQSQFVQDVRSESTFQPWQEQAQQYGYLSVAVLPLQYDDTLHGILVIYADQAYAFDDTEQAVLEELADTISDALAGAETRRQRERYRQMVDTMQEGACIYDAEGRFELVNAYLADFYGTSKQALEGQQSALVQRIREQGDRDRFQALVDGERDELRGEVAGEFPEHGYAVLDYRLTRLTMEGDFAGVVGVAHDMTSYEERTRELAETSRTLQAIIDAAPIAITAVDPDGDVALWNPAAERLFGWTEDEVLDGPTPIIPEDKRDEFDALREQLESGERVVGMETQRRTKDGVRLDVSLSTAPVRDANDEIAMLLGIMEDITERKDRERAIDELHTVAQRLVQAETRESAAELAVEAMRNVLRMPIGAIWLYDATAHALEPVAWTEEARAVVGAHPTFEPGESLSWEVFETGEAQTYADVSTVPGRVNPETEIRSQIILPLGDHGVINIGSTTADAYDDVDVSLAETLATHIETAFDRIEQTQRLREERELLDRLFETSPIGITVLDTDGEIQRANEWAEAVFDLSRDEIIDRAYDDPEWDIFDETGDPISSEELPFQRVLDTGEPVFDHEHGIRHSNGEERWLSINAAPLRAEGRSVDRVVAAISDITDERERGEELLRQNERLNEFAGIVSHDLSNPLKLLEGSLELAEERGDPEDFERCRRAVDRMQRLIDGLLTLAREGKTVGEKDPVAFGDVVRNAWTTLETGDATLEVDASAVMMADEERLRQLVENLLRNAVEHGGDQVQIRVGELSDGFYVEDDGPGIPPDERESVFESGYSTTDGGTGLGLSIVEQLAEAHGWTAQVTDGESGGARIEVTGVDIRERV